MTAHIATTSALLLLAVATSASAQFQTTTFQNLSEPLQESYVKLAAGVAGDVDEQVIRPIATPFFGSRSASKASTKGTSSISETYDLRSWTLKASASASGLSGRWSAGSEGAWIFKTDVDVATIAGGFLKAETTGQTDNWLYAALTDLTTGTVLFESNQQDRATATNYVLGGLTGTEHASFVGSLSNVLASGHTYRLLYRVYAGTEADSISGSMTFADISLQAVPEPATWTLLCGGALLLLARSNRTRLDAQPLAKLSQKTGPDPTHCPAIAPLQNKI